MRLIERFTCATAVFLLLMLTSHAQQVSAIDVTHYRFEIFLSDSTDKIDGRATIQLVYLQSTGRVSFDLTSLVKAKGMTVSGVTKDSKALKIEHNNNQLMIELPEKAGVGDSASFVISYKGIPSDGLIISKNKYGHRTFFGDNWPNRGHNWIPCHDDPADKASVEFIVTAPSHYQVIANGIQVEETNINPHFKLTHWKEDQPVPTKVMVIGCADFAVNLSGVVDCVPVTSWVYPEDRDKGFYDYAQASTILPFFIEHVGPYGYKKLANVETKTIFGGLENANTIFYSEKSITGTRSDEELLTHEIAHQWFGNMATEKSFAHLWLSEGFATYFAILYFENKYGPESSREMRTKDRQDVIDYLKKSNRPVVDTLTKDYMQLLNANSYQKGGWVLHMLRKQIGDSLFWKGIREYYATYAGKNADTDDLRVVFEHVIGTHLEAFFKQWLYTGGVPDLRISWKPGPENTLLVTVIQVQPAPFTFPLEIGLKTATGKTSIQTIQVSHKDETFTLNTADQISQFVADPAVNLLYRGTVTASK